MDPGFAPMVVMVTGILTTGAVLILRPVTSRVGGLLQAITEERRQRAARPVDPAQVRELLAAIDARMSLLEERQDFAEALMSGGERRGIAAPGPGRGAPHN